VFYRQFRQAFLAELAKWPVGRLVSCPIWSVAGLANRSVGQLSNLQPAMVRQLKK